MVYSQHIFSIWICINQILFMSIGIMYEFVWLCVVLYVWFIAVGNTAAAVSMNTQSHSHNNHDNEKIDEEKTMAR